MNPGKKEHGQNEKWDRPSRSAQSGDSLYIYEESTIVGGGDSSSLGKGRDEEKGNITESHEFSTV